MHPWDAIWLFFILSSLQPVVQRQLLALARRRMLAVIAARRRILPDVGRKARRQVEVVARRLLERHSPPDRARDVARLLATGVWTHDHPLLPPDLQLLGLPVRVGVPEEERQLMSLYPQPRGREAAVEFVPGGPRGGRPDARRR